MDIKDFNGYQGFQWILEDFEDFMKEDRPKNMKNHEKHGFCLIFLKSPKPVGGRKDSLKTFGKVIRSFKNHIFHDFS